MTPLQGVALPLIVPAVAGMVFTVIGKVEAVEFPQPLLAVTEIEPPVELAEVVMLAEVEVPDQPEGNVQV